MEEIMDNKKLISALESKEFSIFLNALDQMSASKAYLFIRDELTNNHIKMIKDSGKDNYQLFQDIKIRAKQSWDHDHKVAVMMDIDKACHNVYTLVLRIFKAHNDLYTEELNQIRTAINRIEEKVGLPLTTWEEPKDNSTDGGNNDVNDVQGVQKNI